MSKDIQFLKDFQNELLSQDTDVQPRPRYWSIKDYKWVLSNKVYCDRALINFYDSKIIPIEKYVFYEIGELRKKDFKEKEIQDLEHHFNLDDHEGILNWIYSHDTPNCEIIYEEEVPFISENTLFFTKQEAIDHLKQNKHRYSERAHTYAMTAWRAPKMEKLMKILESFDWDSVEIKEKTTIE